MPTYPHKGQEALLKDTGNTGTSYITRAFIAVHNNLNLKVDKSD